MERLDITAIIIAIIASSGLWSFIAVLVQKKMEKKDAKHQMIMGLGHDRIKYLAEKYIAQGWITADDHEDLVKYLYDPYVKMGGNGTAKKLMDDVNKLPIKKKPSVRQSFPQ
jgi:hypothetical protein